MEVPVLVTNWSILNFRKRGKRITHGICLFNVFDLDRKCNDYFLMPFDNGLSKPYNVGWQHFHKRCQPWDITCKERTDNLISIIGEVYPMVVLRLAKNSNCALEKAFPPFYKKGVRAYLISGSILSHFTLSDDKEYVTPRPLILKNVYMSLGMNFSTLELLSHCLSFRKSTHEGTLNLLQMEKVSAKVCYLETGSHVLCLQSYGEEITRKLGVSKTHFSHCKSIVDSLECEGFLSKTSFRKFDQVVYSQFLAKMDSTSDYFLACASVITENNFIPEVNLGNQYDCVSFPNDTDYVQTGIMAYYTLLSEIAGEQLLAFDAERGIIINSPIQCYAEHIFPFVTDAFCGFPVYTCKIPWFIKACDQLLEKKPTVSDISVSDPPRSPTIDRLIQEEHKLIVYLREPGLYTGNIRKIDCSNFVGTLLSNIDPGDCFLKRLILYRNMCCDSEQKGLIKRGIVYRYGSLVHTDADKHNLVNERGKNIMLQFVSYLENRCGSSCFHIMKDGIIFKDPFSTDIKRLWKCSDENNLIVRDEGTFAYALMISINSYILIKHNGDVEVVGIHNKTDAIIVFKCLEAGINCIKLKIMKDLTPSQCLNIMVEHLLNVIEKSDIPHDYALIGPPPYSYISSCRDYRDSEFIAHFPNSLRYIKVKTEYRDVGDVDSWCYNGTLSGCLMQYIEKMRTTDDLKDLLEKDMCSNFVLEGSLMEPVVVDVQFYLQRPIKVLSKILCLLGIEQSEVDSAFSELQSLCVEKYCIRKLLEIHKIEALPSPRPENLTDATVLLKKRMNGIYEK